MESRHGRGWIFDTVLGPSADGSQDGGHRLGGRWPADYIGGSRGIDPITMVLLYGDGLRHQQGNESRDSVSYPVNITISF